MDEGLDDIVELLERGRQLLTATSRGGKDGAKAARDEGEVLRRIGGLDSGRGCGGTMMVSGVLSS